jgi:SpoIID/LytB domain protein
LAVDAQPPPLVAQAFNAASRPVAQAVGPASPQAAAKPAIVTRTLRVGIARPGGGYDVTTMPIEAYVARVVAGEAARDSAPAALEALAITIRTFALANTNRHRADGFDLCDQTHCQVVRAATAATERAARATAGRILLHGGAPASIYYTASCGGRTEIPSHVWPGADDPPFLPSRGDDACEGAPAWTATIAGRDLQRALRAFGFRGDRLRDMRVTQRNASGRAARVKVDGLEPDEISGQDLRVAVGRTLGWQHIKSTAFELRRQGDAYRFAGHGSGHGVGMCVIGSARLGAQGKSAESILARYFPGLRISATSAPPAAATSAAGVAAGTEVAKRSDLRPLGRDGGASVRDGGRGAGDGAAAVLISLPDGDDGERPAIVTQTARALDDLAKTLGVPPPPRVTIRFHPTTDDYERVTGRAWFTSGSLIGDELHLLPVAVLRERGMLERTIRHEVVHLMVDATLSRRPLWVREGAAIHFAGGDPLPAAAAQRPAFRPEPRASCPDDNELLHPVSVGALSNAYARARACFARQIAAGKSWRDVK